MIHLSQAEENYIKAIFHIQNDCGMEASTNSIAENLATSAASVTDMLRKLSTKNIVIYEKYKGVKLSEEGTKIAIKIVRKHRLWEVFLVQKLNFSWDEVHEVAEELEHIQSSLLIQRLDQFLDYPKFDPHGDPIPNENGEFINTKKTLLCDSQHLTQSKVVGVKDSDSKLLKYLDKIGIGIGTKIKILELMDFDQSLEIEINEKHKTLISNEISKNIYVS
jgi:DtxR family transcriptional regulator, Mn-dependent transcriptional regulator